MSLPDLSRTLPRATRLPDPFDAFGQSDVVGFELVPTPANDEDGEEVGPFEEVAPDGHAPLGEVVGDD